MECPKYTSSSSSSTKPVTCDGFVESYESGGLVKNRLTYLNTSKEPKNLQKSKDEYEMKLLKLYEDDEVKETNENE